MNAASREALAATELQLLQATDGASAAEITELADELFGVAALLGRESTLRRALADASIEHAWGGTLAITPNRLPFVREVEPGLIAVGGFSGLGVVMAPYVGKLVAQAMTGDDADYARLARLPIPRFPGGRLMRWPTLVAAMSFLALRDRLT